VWRTDGQEPRQRRVKPVIDEIVELRRRGFRFIALADDNFYPVTLEDLAMAERRTDPQRPAELQAIRDERFALMEQMAELPDDLVFYTQITMEAAEDPEFLRRIWARSVVVRSVRGRLAFVLISKLYRQMYANTGIATDSARAARSARWARLIARPCRRRFAAKPIPHLASPSSSR
jgi:hypothetical protein